MLTKQNACDKIKPTNETNDFIGGRMMVQSIRFTNKKRALRMIAFLKRDGRPGYMETLIEDRLQGIFIVFYKARG